MEPRVLFCLDEESAKEPALVGLGGENLYRQDWLEIATDGTNARSQWRNSNCLRVAWVLSASGIEPINLAATLKADKPDALVSLLAFEADGSLFSRASNAGIDELLDRAEFTARYAQEKWRGELPEVATADNETPLGAKAPMGTRRARRKGQLLTVVSGSGGAGKSAVAALGAHIAARAGLKTLLLDADMQFGDMGDIAKIAKQLSIEEAIEQPDSLDEFLRSDDSLGLLAAPERLESSDRLVLALPGLISKLQNNYDLIVANTGASWAEQHALLLERSTVALFLVDQRGSSIRACKHALELCSRCGIASTPFRFALNRCSKNAPFTAIDVACTLQGAQSYELKDGGIEVEDCLSGGAIDELLNGPNEFVRSLQFLLASIMPEIDNSTNSPGAGLEKGRGFFRVGRPGLRRKRRNI